MPWRSIARQQGDGRSRAGVADATGAAMGGSPRRATVPAIGAWWWLALLLVLFPASVVRADQNDARLADLFERLRTAADSAEAQQLEARIWSIWIESGREEVDGLMQRGTKAMLAGRLEPAIALFGQVVSQAPGFAEGWNKRATAYFLNEELGRSMEDIRVTLALEPRHFGAIAGMGLIFLRRGDRRSALEAFERVLEIHPHAPGARGRVEALREVLAGGG